MTAGWGGRTARTAVFASVCVLLAALGHVLMSGSQVPPWALAAGLAATGTASWFLTARERGLPLVVTVAVAAQAALHTGFSLTPTPTGPQPMAAMAPGVPMDMAHASGGTGTTVAAAASPGMISAHLLAALLCGLWLAHGERAAFRLLRAAAARLAAPLRLPLAPPVLAARPRPRVRRRSRSQRAPRLLHLVHTITSRGPPAATAVH
ncbi:hypothetical protein ACIQOU_04495 [Streptomyces sp. NPDC091279]|uniref:hypothetical protein n=1 Tax=unclassified Streptomyces TaxID=2593676 RepID=UPI003816EB0B